MSKVSSWDYTSKCTVWSPTGIDKYSQPTGWSRTVFDCSFMRGGDLALDDTAQEFLPRTTVYLEADDASTPETGDRLVLGEDTSDDPPSTAEIVRTVRSFNESTFNFGTPDRVLLTS